MSRNNFLKLAAGVLFVVTAAVQSAHADPFFVQSGSYSISFGNPPLVALAGDGFRLATIEPFGRVNAFDTCNFTCNPATTLDLDATITGFNGTLVPQTFNGVTFTPPTFVAGDLRFAAPMVTLPASLESRVRLSAPFTFAGPVAGSSRARVTGGHVELIGPTLFTGSLVGQGTVTVDLIPALAVGGSPGQFALIGLHYNFAPGVTATPEPATILLIGGGAAAGWRRSRKNAA